MVCNFIGLSTGPRRQAIGDNPQMSRLRPALITLLLAAACSAPSPQLKQAASAPGAAALPRRLVVVGINDVHGALLASLVMAG